MKANLLFWLLLLYSGSIWAQNLSIQESFESSTGDYGYTSNSFNTSLTQYFYRAQNPVPGFGNPAGSANMLNVNGSFFWACEGVRGTGQNTPAAGSVPGVVTLNAINNTQNYTNLKVIVAAGDPRSGTNIARTTDHLRVQYAYGNPNGPYTTLFEFTGTATGASSPWTRVAVQGTNVTGTATVLTSTFSDHESAIPGGIGALYIRVEADYQGSNKEVAFDNIRVTGTKATSAAPQLAGIEATSVNYAEGDGPVQLTNTLTVSDADNTTLTGGTVRIAANFDATEDQLLYTNGSGITGSYNTGTGVLTLSGTATLAAYQAALRSVRYQNTDAANASPLTRTIAFGVTDPSGITSNVATRTITVTTALNAASALPYTENFDTDGEGTRYGSNTRVANSQGFVRLTNASGGSATPGSGFVNGTTTTFTNVQGPGYWYTNGTEGGIVAGSVGQLTLAPVNSTGFVNLNFKVRVGAASSGGGFTSTEFLRFSYSTDGGTSWTVFANYTGAAGQLYLNGNTANPVLDTSLDNADFALPANLNGATISFRAETNSGGSEQIVFDDIQITGQPQTTVSSLVRASASPTNAATVTYTVTFGAPVTGLSATNFSLTTTGTVSGATVGTPVSTGTGSTWTVPVTTGTGNGTLTLNLANDTNLSADITTTLPFAGETYTIDKTAPTVTISSSAGASGSTTATTPILFTVTFTESVTGFVQGDVSVSNGTLSGFSGSGTTYTFTVTPTTAGTATTVNVAANVAQDQAGNGNVASDTYTLTFANAPLTATVSTTASSPTSTAPLPFAVSFSQSVGTSFVASDITVTGGVVTSGSLSGSGAGPYTFTVTPSGTGTVTVSLAAGVASDANTTGNAASNAVSVQYQQPTTTAPVVTSPANNSTRNGLPTYAGTAPAGSTVTVYLTPSGGPAQIVGTTTATDGTFSLAQPTALTSGTYAVYATAQLSGQAGSASSNTNAFTVDATPPTATLTSSAGASTSTAPIPFTLTFSEPVIGLSASGLTVSNGTITSGPTASGGTTYAFSVTPTGNGPVTVSLPAGAAQDAVGNPSLAAPTVSVQYTAPVTNAVTVLYQNGDGNPSNGTIDPFLQLVNNTSAAIPYQELTVRYYLTVENFAPLQATIGYAALGTSGVQARYVALPQPAQGALGYIEYSFSSPKVLGAGASSGVILSHVHKQTYGALDETDDYSYAPNTSNYVATDRIAVYRNGALVGGTEPTPVQAAVQLQALSANQTTDEVRQTLDVVLQVNNLATTPVAYQDLSVRYWFTPEGASPVKATVGYAQLGSNNVSLTLSQAGNQAYAELGFAASLGSLAPLSNTGQLILHLNKQDYSNFDQSNDYSFRPDSRLAANPHVTVYWQGQLVYGQEPTGTQPAAATVRTTAAASVVAAGAATRTVSTLLEAYPNPFEGQTQLHFRPATPGPAQLRVYNALGQVVLTSFEGVVEAGRDYTVPLAGATLTPGVYLVRLQLAGQGQTLRLLRTR